MTKPLLLLFLFAISTSVWSQKAPRVGIAFSGGGAKCMAQLGALRVIEESGIKIDYISGTSMGAVIGALYAMGYSVDEIEVALQTVDWDALLANEIPRNRMPYLNRDDEKYLINFNLEDGNLTLPKAFNFGYYMLKQLEYLTLPAHDITDFSKLPIPFVCLATDLETGEMVYFESGNLADALRASVAFPSLFSPYEVNGRLYVDGGVRNNLPIAVLKEQKDIDYVIALDVQGKLYKKDQLLSIVDVLEQVGSFPNMIYYEEQKLLADMIIRPEIDSYSIADYQYKDTITVCGYNCAKSYLPELACIAALQNADSTMKMQKSRLADIPNTLYIDTIFISGASKTQGKIITDILHIKIGQPYPISRLDRGLDLLYGSSGFDKVGFSYHKLSTGKNLLKIDARVKSSRHSMRFGLHYDDDFSIALLTNYTMRSALFLNAKFMAEVAISENPRGSVSYIFEKGYIPALGFRFSFNRFQPRLYRNSEPISQFNFVTYNFDLFLHSTIFNNYTIGSGFKLDNVDLSESIPIIGLSSKNQYGIYHAFLNFDSYNRSFNPQTGFKLIAKFNLISEFEENLTLKDPTSVLSLNFGKAIKFNKKAGLIAGFTGATTIGGDAPYPYQFFVGGLGQNYINFTFPFLGYRHMELIGRNFLALRGDFYYEVGKNHYLGAKANVGKLEPTLNGLYNSDVVLDGYGLSYAYNSPIGPLELTVMGSSNHSKVYTYINIGFWF